jgi:hypothetical protein
MTTPYGCLAELPKTAQRLARHGFVLALGLIFTAPSQAESPATEGKVYCRTASYGSYGVARITFAEKI